MRNLERLLKERQARLWKLRNDRHLVAAEDLIRCRQGWRKPWYRVGSQENSWPPKWMRGTQ